MIELFDKHLNSRLAIIGSGPSATLYTGGYEVSIAVNGASLLPYNYKYFLCGDHNSYKRSWFNVNSAEIRIIADLVALMDKNLYPDYENRVAYPYHKKHLLPRLPKVKSPHIVFSYKAFDLTRLSKNMDHLLYGGTISCCALQLAWVMGASIVDIYGCNFDHSNGHYFYESKDVGRVNVSQLETMQTVIDNLRLRGLIINVIGDSKLT